MSNFGIRISEVGIDVNTTPTSSNKKNFVFLSDENSPKVFFAGFVEETTPFTGISYSHNLGRVPIHFLFEIDSITSPTYYKASSNVRATTTTITSTLSKGYLIILSEGT